MIKVIDGKVEVPCPEKCDDGRDYDASHGASRRCRCCNGTGLVTRAATPFELSRASFESYAAMDGETLPEDALSAIQVRFARWEVGNFGYQPTSTNVLGCSEEMGEMTTAMAYFFGMHAAVGRLSHITLKSGQNIRGFADKEYAREQVADAIADVFVFGFNLCTALRLDAGTIFRATAEKVLKRDWKKKPSGPTE